jgi:hypothetical protein
MALPHLQARGRSVLYGFGNQARFADPCLARDQDRSTDTVAGECNNLLEHV